MNPQAATLEGYLKLVPSEKVDGARKMIELMREQLPDADEDVRWGIAIFSRNGRDIAGIAARKGYYCLYVPDAEVVEKYLPKLGRVKAGEGCIRFRNTKDVKRPALARMVRELATLTYT